MQDLGKKEFTTDIGGTPVTLQVSRIAGQANGAVIGSYGETVVLATAVIAEKRVDKDFFPLTVDYEERFYAVGKVLGSRFMRREGRPPVDATLSARLIDRAIRPLFPEHLRNEIHVVVTVLSYDGEHDPDIIALLSASTALAISDIPWGGPVAGAGERGERSYFFAGVTDHINMIEFQGKETPEEDIVGYFEKAQAEINRLIAFQETIVKAVGKTKLSFPTPDMDSETQAIVEEVLAPYEKQAESGTWVSGMGEDAHQEITEKLRALDKSPGMIDAAGILFEHRAEAMLSRLAFAGKRVDGRALDEVRPLYAQVGLLPRTHGSALFARGSTQVLAVTTTAPPSSEQLVESIEDQAPRRFMLHYNFPSFSTGEVGRGRGGPGRREIGHGALAEKAIAPFIPSKETFPYVIRVVAETLSSNGSSSMATVCATSLSLMDAGVPIPGPIAGIAMGFVEDNAGKYVILTDIQGPEDHFGKMDLKVAGTARGVNAVQMDVKTSGITKDLFARALPDARAARLHILETMNEALAASREHVSPHAPTIRVVKINKDRIGEVIGPGGRMIHHIIESAGNDTSVDVEEDGSVYVSGKDRDSVAHAVKLIEDIVHEYAPGDSISGTVLKLLDFGAIVDLGGGQSGMIHISELSDKYVERVSDILKEGDHVRAKVIKVDRDNGKIGLSLKGA